VHELSIALSLLDEIANVALREKATRVSRVRLRVGRMSGVARDALLFAWELARSDTVAAQAELLIEDVPLSVFCSRCQCERVTLEGGGLVCGICGAPSPTVVAGRELKLVSVEVDS